jgi:hypothetical protein
MNQGARAKRARDVGTQRGRSRLRATQTRGDRSLCDRAGALEDIPRRPRSARRASRLARVRRGRGRGVPALRNLGARVRAREVRRLRLVPSRRVLVSATRLLSPCIGRRMADFAAHLVDRVAPPVPLRQWVLTGPYPLRARMMYDPALTTLVLRELIAAVSSWLRRRARRLGIRGALKAGAIAVVQRFNSALDASPHFHTLFLDGVYSFPVGSMPVFHPTPAPRTRTSRWLPPQSAAVSSASSQSARRPPRSATSRRAPNCGARSPARRSKASLRRAQGAAGTWFACAARAQTSTPS